MASNKIIGIDLGTTNSVVAVMEGAEPKVLINHQGARTTPSVVGFTDKGERLVGQPARHQQVTNPTHTVFSIKRFMGRRHREVSSEEKQVPYQVTGGAEELVKVKVRDKEYTPQEVSAMVLQELKKVAEDYLGDEVTRAVITVPAYFNDSQRTATKEAGEIAGLTVERIINEPTAAALAYGLEKQKNEIVAVFDFGGGTFDVSILDIGEGVFEVLSTKGDTHLGGDDLDEILIGHIADDFKRTEGIDLRNDPMALQRLKEAAEKAKCELSTAMEANINLPFITATADGPKHLTMTLTRAKFEQLCEPVLLRLVEPCKEAWMDAFLRTHSDVKNSLEKKMLTQEAVLDMAKRDLSIDEVILVGGSTRVQRVRDIVKEIFGKEPNKSVNPDEVVAIGAAIQGSMISGETDNIVLTDVTPLSLGVETLGGVMTKMIERNTTIPTEKKEVYSTAADSQTEVTIHVLQGEREFARDNRTLGRFNLTGLPPAPRGVPQVEVAFNIDVNGILNVKATDHATGTEQSIEITGSSGLSQEDVDKMKADAETHAEDDKRRRELVDLKNRGDSMAFQMEKMLKDQGEKVSPEDRSAMESGVTALRETLKGDEKDAIERAMESLEQASHKVAEQMYAASGAQQAPEGGPRPPVEEEAPAGGKDDDDVIDAEFEVKE